MSYKTCNQFPPANLKWNGVFFNFLLTGNFVEDISIFIHIGDFFLNVKFHMTVNNENHLYWSLK